MTKSNGVRLALATTAALALAGCESSGNYRIASVGTASADPGDAGTSSGGNDTGSGGTGSGGTGSGTGGTGSGTGTGGTGTGNGTTGGNGLLGGVLVTGGNTVIGAAGKHSQVAQGVNALIPGSGIVTGKVTRILQGTGQTLVQLGSGNTLILGKAGGRLGDLLSINLGNGKVIGGPTGSPLIGLNVLAANPVTGKLATVTAASAGQLVSVTVPGTTNTGLLGNGLASGGLLHGPTNGLTNVLATPATGTANGSASTGLTGTVTTTVKAVVAPTGTNSVIGKVTAPLQGVLGGILPPKPPK